MHELPGNKKRPDFSDRMILIRQVKLVLVIKTQ